VTVRPLAPADLRFLRRMLVTALFWRRRRLGPLRVVLLLPQVAMYHRGWGRPGDAGFVSEEAGRPIGAVWYRFFTEDGHGEGYVDPETPELAIAVADGFRGRGVGRRLMEAMHEHARAQELRRVSLSVDADNPARRLYAALGYEDYEPEDGNGRMLLTLG
jgi:ribosomal protein S18 acetylase RimI-like enzyme